MGINFQADCRPVLIGSLPLKDHDEAVRWVFEYTPEIPLWVQLPIYKEEGMIKQFLPGMPGLTTIDDKVFIDTGAEGFERDLLGFYEEYVAVGEGRQALSDSRFVLTPDSAPGFSAFTGHLERTGAQALALKGQVTGPITFCTGVHDQNGRAIFYDAQLRDAAVKLLALKARWQVQQLLRFKRPVFIFFDEPALAGFGSSEFISITPEEIQNCFEEVFAAVHSEGGLAGVHICANTDWSLVLGSEVDIVNFDAYAYFDRFILYPDQIKKFIESGRILAWGLVPTLNTEDIERETTDRLLAAWEERLEKIQALGLEREKILRQSLITPSCGAGSLSLDLAQKVLRLTSELSACLNKSL